jgi:hypothetical protein
VNEQEPDKIWMWFVFFAFTVSPVTLSVPDCTAIPLVSAMDSSTSYESHSIDLEV